MYMYIHTCNYLDHLHDVVMTELSIDEVYYTLKAKRGFFDERA